MSVLENLFFVTSDCWSIAYISASYKLIHNLLRHFPNIQSSLLSKSFRQAKIFPESTFLSKSFTKQVFKTSLRDDPRARLLSSHFSLQILPRGNDDGKPLAAPIIGCFRCGSKFDIIFFFFFKRKKNFLCIHAHTHKRRSEPASLTRRSLRGCCWASTKENSIRQTQFSTQWMPSIIPVVPRGGGGSLLSPRQAFDRPASWPTRAPHIEEKFLRTLATIHHNHTWVVGERKTL